MKLLPAKALKILHILVAILISWATNVIADSLSFEPQDQVVENGAHKVIIKRIFPDEAQGKLILAAESEMPSREDVIKVMDKRGMTAMEAIQPKELWWHDKFDDTLIPYAITKQCLLHLADRSKGFQKSIAEGRAELEMKYSKLDYSAIVNRYQRFEYEGQEFHNVSVVTMALSWNQQAMWFTKKRVIVFDEAGRILKIFHDGVTKVGVS